MQQGGDAAAIPKLADLKIFSIVDAQGLILSEPIWTAQAYVFAVYDEHQKLQYFGFSRDLKNSLRTLLSRRPEKAHFFKAHGLTQLDQEAMVAIRAAWFDEVGGAPPGNKLALERALWQQSTDAGAISQRGKKAAAEDKAKQVLEAIKQRGCKEEFVVNPSLLSEGLVDFMPYRSLTAEEVEEQRAERAAAVKAVRTAVAIIDGVERKYQIAYRLKFPTNGGYLMDITVMLDGKETKHRVIVGRDYYEPHGAIPELVVEAAMSLLLSLKVSRQTDGVLLSSQYPINYFSISQVEQWFRSDFRAELAKVIGDSAFDVDRDTDFWRFNRVFDYGPMKLEDANDMNIALNEPIRRDGDE